MDACHFDCCWWIECRSTVFRETKQKQSPHADFPYPYTARKLFPCLLRVLCTPFHLRVANIVRQMYEHFHTCFVLCTCLVYNEAHFICLALQWHELFVFVLGEDVPIISLEYRNTISNTKIYRSNRSIGY